MTAKISEALGKRLTEAEQEEIPVIVTVTAGTDPAILVQQGLKIHHTFTHIPAIAGTLTAAAVHDMAQLAQVEHIDYDSKAWAL
jgi:hypothetical protein